MAFRALLLEEPARRGKALYLPVCAEILPGAGGREAPRCPRAGQDCVGGWGALPCPALATRPAAAPGPPIGRSRGLITNADAASVSLSSRRRSLLSPPPSPPLDVSNGERREMKTVRCEWLEIQRSALAAVLCRSRLQTSYLWFFGTNCLQVFEGWERTYRLCVSVFCVSSYYLAFSLDNCVQSFMWKSFYWREIKRILNLILFGSFYFYGKWQHISAERSFFAAVLVLSPSLPVPPPSPSVIPPL